MTVDACAEKVRLGDPDRFATALIAPPEMRGRLMVLYAFNLEIARAPWVTNEPMIAQMRLQFWSDVIDDIAADKQPRAHDVAGPLADLIQTTDLPLKDLHAMVQARLFDIDREPFQDAAALAAYTQATAGNLMWLAAKALGAAKDCRETVLLFGGGTGVAKLFLAHTKLSAQGHNVLSNQSHEAISQIARNAQNHMRIARRDRHKVPKACRAAMIANWQADGTLRRAVKSPQSVLDGALGASDFSKRAGLLWRSVSPHW